MKNEELYLNIINQLRDGIYFVDRERRITFWNKAAEEITGYPAEEIVGLHCQESKLSHIDLLGRPLCILGCPLYATLADGVQRQDRVFVRHREGYRVPIRVNIFPILQDGRVEGAVEVFTKDSPTVFEDDLVERLSEIAMHDELTRLPNRRYLESFLSYRMEEYKRFGRNFCVLYADVDNFSRVNNTYGHEAGDIVLKNIASSLQLSTRRDDLVGRWGGEEFLGVYTISSPSECQLLGERFRTLVANTEAMAGDTVIHTTISVGITPVRPNDTVQTVTDRADQLMYLSKRSGKNRVSSDVQSPDSPN